MLPSVQYSQIFSVYVESRAKVMSENTYENEITYRMHCVVYGGTCFNVWDFCVSKAKHIDLLCVPLCIRGLSAPPVSMSSCNSESKALCPRLLGPVSVWLGDLLATTVLPVCLPGLSLVGTCGGLKPHLGMLCAKSSFSYSSFGVFILLSYLHECIQPEFPEHGDFASQPLLH